MKWRIFVIFAASACICLAACDKNSGSNEGGDGGSDSIFGDPCDDNSECPGGLCHGGMESNYCTILCMKNSECRFHASHPDPCCEKVGEQNICLLPEECGIPFGLDCEDDSNCRGGICYDYQGYKFCTMTCFSDGECQAVKEGSCCHDMGETKVCGNCSNPPDGDRDVAIECIAGTEKRCGVSPDTADWVEQCNYNGDGWDILKDCAALERICIGGECVSEDGDTEEEFPCGDPNFPPDPITWRAEDMFNKDESDPSDKADIVDSRNPRFDDGTFVHLDASIKGQELVFNLDIDRTYEYVFLIRYVCGLNYGEVSLYLDDSEYPLYQTETIIERDRINLNHDNCVDFDYDYNSMPREPIVAYEPVCIQADDNHRLRLRVYGKVASSGGYDIGVDDIYILPTDREEER